MAENNYEIELDPKLFNPLYWHIKDALNDQSIRFIFIYGGSGAAKTFEITNGILTDALENNKNTLVARKESTELKDTVWAAFLKITNNFRKFIDLFEDTEYNLYVNESHIRFRGVDKPDKIQGLENYDRIFLNEIRNFTLNDFKEVKRRLRGKAGQQIIADWNPVDKNHWIKKEVINKSEFIDLPLCLENNKYSQLDKKYSEKKISKDGRTLLIKTTYRDNKWITGSDDGTGYKDVQALADFEDMRINNPEDYEIYGLGNWGVMTSRLIFAKNWEEIDELPENVKQIPYGMDFGFSPDPTVCIGCYEWTDKQGRKAIVLDEEFWEQNLVPVEQDNMIEEQSIQSKLEECGVGTNKTIVADNENKTIQQLIYAGYEVYPAKKGPDSIIPGVKLMKSYYFYITKRSNNLINEFENYKKQVDKNGIILPKPIDKFNHGIDSVRYVITAKDLFW